MKKAIQAILPTAEAIQRLLHPYVEAIRCTHLIVPRAIPHTEVQIFASREA